MNPVGWGQTQKTTDMYFNKTIGRYRFVVHIATRYGKNDTETRREIRVLKDGRRILTIPIGDWEEYGYGSG